jgi:hypothetical protein
VHIEILGVIDVLIRSGLNPVDYAGLQIEENGSRYVSCVVGLVEEDIFAIASLCRKLFEVSILIDAMLNTQLPPELRADCEMIQ